MAEIIPFEPGQVMLSRDKHPSQYILASCINIKTEIMVIIVNDNKKEVNDNINVGELLTELSILDTQGMAIAVNNKVVRKDNWNSHSLQPEDSVIMIKATKGG